MPVTRSQTLSKDKNMSEQSATEAAFGDSSPVIRARNWGQTHQAGDMPGTHPEGKDGKSEKKAQFKKAASSTRQKQSPGKQITCSCIFFRLIIFVAAGCLIVPVIIRHTSIKEGQGGSDKPSIHSSNMANVEKNISILQENFLKQEEDLWETVKAAVDYHFSSEPDPECPIILMFGSHPDASETSKCLVKKLGRTLSQVLGKESPADFLHEIDGEVLQNQNADQAKMDMDRGLRKAFQGKPGKKVATVLNLDSLPPCSVLLFHGYCDTDNAIFKDVAMIFTVTLDDRSPRPSSPKDWEPLVMDHLKRLWVDKCSSLPLEKVEAFLSRITNNVVFVRKEESPKC